MYSAEIEGLMQALDEEEKELEVMENKSHELEQMLQEKEFALRRAEFGYNLPPPRCVG